MFYTHVCALIRIFFSKLTYIDDLAEMASGRRLRHLDFDVEDLGSIGANIYFASDCNTTKVIGDHSNIQCETNIRAKTFSGPFNRVFRLGLDDVVTRILLHNAGHGVPYA
jgi:hypothetical protein